MNSLNKKKAHFKDIAEIADMVIVEEDEAAEDDRSEEEIKAF